MAVQESIIYFTLLVSVLFAVPAYSLLLRFWIQKVGLGQEGAMESFAALDQALLPPLTLIIPVFNEESLIVSKLRNSLELQYPIEKIRIIVVDGGSTDRTLRLADNFSRTWGSGRIEVLKSPRGGKIPQLNYVLKDIAFDQIVVLTDADAEIISKDALLKAVAALQVGTGVGVFGGFTKPPGDESVPGSERLFWAMQNRLRRLESSAFSSNIALAPFYAFSRRLFSEFPEDCVADDVFVSFVSHVQRKRVIYSPDVLVTEKRFPSSPLESYFHKLRKTRAYTLELLRSIPHLLPMQPRARAGCIFRLVMFGYWPWAALYCLVSLPRHLSDPTWATVTVGVLAFAAGVFTTSVARLDNQVMATSATLRAMGRFTLAVVELSILVTATLLSNFLLAPFGKQNSIYRKVTGST